MNPTRAPWADGANGDVPPSDSQPEDVEPAVRKSHHTGTPVQALIAATPALPVPKRSGWPSTWQPAAKMIRTPEDVKQALKGSTLQSFVSFTMALNESVIGVKNSDPCSVSPAVQALLDCLTKLDEFVKATPAVTQEVRYGNPAFRDWYDKMKDAAPELVYNIVGDDLGEATIEILPYLLDSFGNRTRIDYGTGHETAFVCFLYCLFCLGVLKEDDCKATVIKVFHAYLALMRDIQTTYWCASSSDELRTTHIVQLLQSVTCRLQS